MSFKVIKPGFQTSVQDLGRFGLSHVGLSHCGAIDEHAYRWANYLLDNNQNDATLEITLGNCELEAKTETTICITGADLNFKINNKNKTNWQTHHIEKGDVLTWSTAKNGMRAYLAVKDGLQTKVFFNSRSVNVREHIGRLIQTNDELLYKNFQEKHNSRSVPKEFIPNYQTPLTVRVLPSYQFESFSKQQREIFLNQNYILSNQSDRTGYRIQGNEIENIPTNLVSEGMCLGSVEITNAGLPIILMNDSPTIGGYPKIGTVFSLDLAQLAQRQANTEINFELINIEEAQNIKKEFLAFFK